MRPIGTRIALHLPRVLTERLDRSRGVNVAGTAPAAPDSPFLAARTEFTNAFGDLARGKRNWQLMAFGLGGLLALVTVAYVRLAASARVVPYVVQVDRLGQVVAVGRGRRRRAARRPVDRLPARAIHSGDPHRPARVRRGGRKQSSSARAMPSPRPRPPPS